MPHDAHRSTTRPIRARGSIYALVLATVGIAVAMVMGGLELTGVASRKASLYTDMVEARQLANSALEQACAVLDSTSAWRTTYASGTVTLPIASMTGGTMSAQIADLADAAIGDDVEEDITVYGIGRFGGARQMVQTTLRPTPRGYGALACAAHATTLSLGGTIVASAPLCSAGNAVATSARVGAPVVASGTVSGSVYLRPTTAGAATLTRPTTAALTYWGTRGVLIDISSLPGDKIDGQFLLPNNNPFGSRATSTVYVINCDGKNITIKDSRINATLVLVNTGNKSQITGGVSLEPPAGQPALLVYGPIDLNINKATITDAQIAGGLLPGLLGGLGLGGNTYTCKIKGIVYSTGNTALRGTTLVEGAVITDSVLTVSDTPTIDHDASLYTNPPRGFWDALDLRVVSGSWKQTVDP